MSGRRVSMSVPQMRRGACVISLSYLETRLVAFLLATPPDRFVPMDEIIGALWENPDDEPEGPPDRVISVVICRVRKLGIQIENDWGNGFRVPGHARGV